MTNARRSHQRGEYLGVWVAFLLCAAVGCFTGGCTSAPPANATPSLTAATVDAATATAKLENARGVVRDASSSLVRIGDGLRTAAQAIAKAKPGSVPPATHEQISQAAADVTAIGQTLLPSAGTSIDGAAADVNHATVELVAARAELELERQQFKEQLTVQQGHTRDEHTARVVAESQTGYVVWAWLTHAYRVVMAWTKGIALVALIGGIAFFALTEFNVINVGPSAGALGLRFLKWAAGLAWSRTPWGKKAAA